jgi:ATP-binding cassette subfamily B protein
MAQAAAGEGAPLGAMSDTDLTRLGWPPDMLSEAVWALKGHLAQAPDARAVDRGTGGPQTVEGAARQFGLEAEAVTIRPGELPELLRSAGPALLEVELEDGRVVMLGLRESGSRGVRLLGPDLIPIFLSVRAIADALTRPAARRFAPAIDALLGRASAPRAQVARARAALLAQRVAQVRIGTCWLLRQPPATSWREQARASALGWRLSRLLLAHVAFLGTGLLVWWLIARGALMGRIDRGWLLAGLLSLVSMVPIRTLIVSWTSRVAVDLGALLQRRLLSGAFEIETSDLRSRGVGELLGTVLESQLVAPLAIQGGLDGTVALVELVAAGVILGLGGGLAPMLLLFGFAAVMAWLAHGLWRGKQSWTKARLGLTHDLIERMVGHRTRLAQEKPAQWHEGEDAALRSYLDASRSADRAWATLSGLVPRGFITVAVLAIAARFLVPSQANSSALALCLGGSLLGHRALRKLTASLPRVLDAGVAWSYVAPLARAAARGMSGTAGGTRPASPQGSKQERPFRLEAREMRFAYKGRRQLLEGCSLSLSRGDRILLEGRSGGGKSTLASLLAGLERPSSGLLLLDGLDLFTLGREQWRTGVVAVPQFHQNYVLSGSFAFNLLLSRGWPPEAEDLADAERVCQELGLGPLLSKMPSGLFQAVGETGWKLSHGERSRLYIARALLQDPDLLILDESLGALDPDAFKLSFDAVVRRARSLLLIAHP